MSNGDSPLGRSGDDFQNDSGILAPSAVTIWVGPPAD
jgi:hypothetical protein